MPNKNPPPGTLPGQILRALGSIYGTTDAGRAWYLRSKKILSEYGWEESCLERSVFVLRDRTGGENKVVAVMFAHVDDLLLACNQKCSWLDAHLQTLAKRLHLERRDGVL